ncbi:MAG: hypothetical protein U1F43_05215 [Myxococcota bacterium]
MAQKKSAESELMSAAKGLERALDELATSAEIIQRAPLTSQRHFEKAAEHLAGVAAAEAEIRARLAALEAAMAGAIAARDSQLAAIAQRRTHIEARQAELQRLFDRYAELGIRAMQAGAVAGPAARAAAAVDVEALLASARAGDFPDVVRLAEVLLKSLRP